MTELLLVTGRGLLLLLLALAIAWSLHSLLHALLRRIVRKHASFLVETVAARTSRPVRLSFLLLAVAIVSPELRLMAWGSGALHHALEVGWIVAIAWLLVGLLDAMNALVEHRLPENREDNVRARRTRTQVHLLRQMLVGLTWFTALAAVLMTFPTIRTIGAGLFASAGLAGLAVGIAARPTLSNLIAGIQIAITEHIRLDDAVVVEGEWGRVAEVSTTYVVVRLWDLRHMIVPLSYFIEKPFQNWTRYSSELIGAVLLYLDYTVPVAQVREEFGRILASSPLWDGRVKSVQVTDMKEHTVEVRLLMSAANPPATFDLRCEVREKLIEYLQRNHPGAFPRVRASILRETPASGN